MLCLTGIMLWRLGPLEGSAAQPFLLHGSRMPQMRASDTRNAFLPALPLTRSGESQCEIQLRHKRELKMSKPREADFLVILHIAVNPPSLLQKEVT